MAATSFTRPDRLLLVSGALSLLAVGLGAWVCAATGIAPAVWARNPATWLAGAAAAFALSRWARASFFPAVLSLAALTLVATLFSSGQLGVHRWIEAGPVSMNIAMMALPAAIVALAALDQRAPRRWLFATWLLALACLAVLVVQPDASQATAFALAVVWIALARRARQPMRWAAAGAAVLLATAAWLRPDPLKPVPEVEEILALAYSISPWLAVLALASLLACSLAPALLVKGGSADARIAGAGLSLYLFVCALMPFIGAFPVPLTGVGISPVVGTWLGVASLAALLRKGEPARA